MRKVLCVLCALLICVSLASVAFAASPARNNAKVNNNTFYIVDKDGNVIVQDHTCLSIVAVNEAAEGSQLKELYAQLKDGSMKLPYGENVDADSMSVKNLYEIKVCDECAKILAEPGNTLKLTLKVGVNKANAVVVMTYADEAWSEIVAVDVKANGDVECTFEDLGIVALSVGKPAANAEANPFTGDMIMMWVGIMVVAAGAVVALMAVRRKAKN